MTARIIVPPNATPAQIDAIVERVVADLHAVGEVVRPEGIRQLREQIASASNAPSIELPPLTIWPDASDAEIAAIVDRLDAENREAGAGPMTARLRARVAATIAFFARREVDEDTLLQ
jgi:hypothetical protein